MIYLLETLTAQEILMMQTKIVQLKTAQVKLQRRHGKNNQILIPDTLRVDIMTMAHDMPMCGHFAYNKTIDRIWSHYFWPGMTKDIRLYYASCDQARHFRFGLGGGSCPKISEEH